MGQIILKTKQTGKKNHINFIPVVSKYGTF